MNEWCGFQIRAVLWQPVEERAPRAWALSALRLLGKGNTFAVASERWGPTSRVLGLSGGVTGLEVSGVGW